MPRKAPPTGTDADLNLASMTYLFAHEDAAREFLEARLWPNGPVCPHCGSKEAYALTARPGSKKPVRKGVYKCKECRKQFSVRVGTIFEDSKLPISKWLMAIHLLSSSKKGISSLQISRELGITQKSAWFVNHRIREAMRDGGPPRLLKGTVEADETYVGGKPRGRGMSPRGRGTKKTPVVALVERDGGVRAGILERVTSKELGGYVRKHVSPDATLMTDEFVSYEAVGKEFARHGVICHKDKVYVCGDVTTNTVEAFFALLKRGHYGAFHQLSKKHLHRYVNEFAFRWNHRKISDGHRMTAAIVGATGKRLMYKQSCA